MHQHTGKYRALWLWLSDRTDDDVHLGFAAIEDVLGFALPPSSRKYLAHWYGYGGSAVGRAIRDAGWRAAEVNLTAQTVHFRRQRQRGDEAALADELGRRGVDEVLAGLLLGYAADHAVEFTNSDRKNELALGASHDAYAAVFVSGTSLSIVLDPADAKDAYKRHSLRIRESTAATWHVVVGSAEVVSAEVEEAVRRLIELAFERSDCGPRWRRGLPDRKVSRGRICATCFLEMPLSGICPNCG